MSDSDNEHIDTPPENPADVELAQDAGKVAAMEAELAEMKDRMLRAMAETDNVRRRADKEREDTAKFAISKFALNLLPVADNLRRAVEAIPAEHDNEFLNRLVEGVEATERALLGAFEKASIVKIEAMEKPFDANFHEVMVEIDNPDKTPGTVVQQFETGYMIGERLLRPARVAIAKGGARERVDTNA